MSACISLGLMLPGVLGKIAMAVGIVYSIFFSLVGVFPMNNEKAHGFVAMSSFRAGLLTIFLFSLGIALQRVDELFLSRWFALAGLPAMLSFAGFLILAPRITEEEDPWKNDDIDRPRVWPLVVVEWLIFVSMVLWFIIITLGV